jgi:hypothetical protein
MVWGNGTGYDLIKEIAMSNYTREKENSITLFNFNAEHNGEPCIASLRPEDANTPNAFWFTVAMLCTIYGEVDNTIRRNIESLSNDREVDLQKCKSRVITQDSDGNYHNTSIYNLEILNKLGMCCFRGNKKAKEIRDKFNDVLVKSETNQIVNIQSILSDPDSAILLLTQYKEAKLKQKEAEARALQAEAERDEAKRTKTRFQEGLASKMAARVGGLTNANRILKEENAELKDRIGRGESWRTISMMKDVWIKNFGHVPTWQKIKGFSESLPPEEQPKHDVEETITLPDGSTKNRLVYRYHMKAWGAYMQYENGRLSNKE